MIAAAWIAVTGAGGQKIELSVAHIVTVRPPHRGDHYGPGVRCIVHTTDGKFVATIEDCDTVHALLTPPD